MVRRVFAIVFAMFALSNFALADGHVKRIISTGTTGLGNDIVYPEGKAKVTAFEFTVPVGGPVTPHSHSFPVLVIMQEGEATITYEDGQVQVYRAGEAFIEDVGIIHSSENTGTVTLRALVVAIRVEGQKILTPAQ